MRAWEEGGRDRMEGEGEKERKGRGRGRGRGSGSESGGREEGTEWRRREGEMEGWREGNISSLDSSST